MINQFSSRPLEDYVTVLAIYDDPPSSSQQSSLLAHLRYNPASNFQSEPRFENTKKNRSLCAAQNSPTIISVDSSDGQTSAHTVYIEPAANDVVEVTSLDELPSYGLQVVSSNNTSAVGENLSGNSSPLFPKKTAHDRISKTTKSVPMSPSPVHLSFQSNARKSRFTDAFLDAKERLDQEFEYGANITTLSPGSTNFRYSKIVLSSETVDVFTGVEISAVPDPDKPNRIIAVEVIRIEDGGRISEDGRIKVGDQITEINNHPCTQMSLARARLYLRDLEQLAEPSLAFNRQIETFDLGDSANEHASYILVKPIKTALQQGNTSKIGETLDLVVKKDSDGFEFSFAGRFNAMNEHLFYVKTVKSGGASCGKLKIGDRLLKIEGEDLSCLQQSDVTNLLKSKKVGESIAIQVSRIPEHAIEEEVKKLVTTPQSPKSAHSVTFKEENESYGRESNHYYLHSYLTKKLEDIGCELVEFDIALNDSPSAGLGISLKAQRMYNDGLASDSGLYIRSVLHGSAAYKDGRLRIDDRLVAIEDVNLLKYKLNGEALEAFIKCLSMMPTNAFSVKVFVARKKDIQGAETKTEFFINKTVIPPTKQEEEISLADQLKHHGESESDISVLQDDTDAFVRDTVIRKSISEKRPLGVHNDPSHLQTYQRIKHNRQTSAPSIDSLLRTSPSQGYVKNRSRRRSLGNSLGQHKRLSIPPMDSVKLTCAEPISLRPLTYYRQTTQIEGGQLDNETKNSFAVKKLATSVSFTHSKECVAGKKTFSSSKFLGLFRSSGSKNLKEVDKPTKVMCAVEVVGMEEGDASPKRRSASIEPFAVTAAGRSFDSRVKKGEPQSATHRRIQSSALPKTGIPSSISQPALGSAFKNYEQAPFASISNLKEDKNRAQRRKSTGSGFLKFLHKVGPSSYSPDNFHVGDEQNNGLQQQHKPHKSSRSKTYEMREESSLTTQLYIPYSSPQQTRQRREDLRAPPPPYHRPPPIYPTYSHHQRVYSAQEPPHHNYKQMSNEEDEFVYEGGCMDTQTHIATPISKGVQQRAPSMIVNYISDATNYHPHQSTCLQSQWLGIHPSTTNTVSPASPSTTTTLSMPGLHTARRCQQGDPPPIPPPHYTSRQQQQLPPPLKSPLPPPVKPGNSSTRPPSMGTRVRVQERPTPNQSTPPLPMNPSHFYPSTTDSRLYISKDPTSVCNYQSLDYRRAKKKVQTRSRPNTFLTTATTSSDSTRNYSQTHQQRSRMRKAVASAVFYDDCEAPVRC